MKQPIQAKKAETKTRTFCIMV
uniref:Uncharacterized protein n=1 Tax=Anguilla anguilla TaxID=7936 RepID=A0A0E9UIA6_ANGAN